MQGLPDGKVLMQHYRIDQKFSNSYEAWKKMGSPKSPSKEQIDQLEKAGQLELYTSPQWVTVKNGAAIVNLEMPRQAVSFIKYSW